MELFFALDFFFFPFSKPTFLVARKYAASDLTSMILMVVFGPFNSLDIQSECAFPILAQEFRVKSEASGKETTLNFETSRVSAAPDTRHSTVG